MELIDRAALYRLIAEKEELARNRVVDTPTNSPVYMRYVAQLNERTELKHAVADVPTIDAVPVVHGRWIPVDEKNDAFDCSECIAMVQKRCNYCPNCGAKMGLEG